MSATANEVQPAQRVVPTSFSAALDDYLCQLTVNLDEKLQLAAGRMLSKREKTTGAQG